jgi:hypothetical protein
LGRLRPEGCPLEAKLAVQRIFLFLTHCTRFKRLLEALALWRTTNCHRVPPGLSPTGS